MVIKMQTQTPMPINKSVAPSVFFRDIKFGEVVSEDDRTIELSFSSELPYDRGWGIEILDHAPSSVRLGRLNNAAPLLVNHNPESQVGVVELATIGDNRRSRAVVRFGQSALANEIWQDVKTGIRQLVSVGYQHFPTHVVEGREGDKPIIRFLDWEPFEVSLVSIPADPSVGIGRASGENAIPSFINIHQRNQKMETTLPDTVPAAAAPIIDTRNFEKQGEQRALDRVTAMLDIGARHAQQELAATFIRNGKSVDELKDAILDQKQTRGDLKVADTPFIGMSEKEAKRFSFIRAMLAVTEPNNAEAQKAAGFEYECSTAARNKNPKENRQGGITVPSDVLHSPLSAIDPGTYAQLARAMGRQNMQRDLTVGVATAGGNLVATDLLAASFVDLLINQMVIMQMGTTLLSDLQGNVAIPRQTAGAAGTWVGENVTAIESQAAIDQISLTPKSAGVFTDYGRRLLLQSSISVESFVRMDLARTLALMIDSAAINGTGATNQPRGILATAGIGSEAGGANGLAPTWDNIVNLESLVANANASLGALHYLTNTKARGKLKRTQMFSGTNGIPVWPTDNMLNGYTSMVSNQVPSTLTKGTSVGVASAIIFGNFADLIIGMWGGLDILVDPYTGSSARTTRIVAFQDVDVAVRHPESFAAMQDALTV